MSESSSLYDRPVLVLDPGMHTAPIRRADVDAAGNFAVTASQDKTVRVWSLAHGKLVRTIRLPAGPGNVGKAYAVAISPDGMTIAAGGWTHPTDEPEQIYFFDRANGLMTHRIVGLTDRVIHLAFSRDGARLAAALRGSAGLRTYGSFGDGGWQEVARDADYGDSSYGVAFAGDGRLATTSWDGRLRLYDTDGRLLLRSASSPHPRPTDLSFNPVDGRLAVGFVDSTQVLLYDRGTFAQMPSPDVGGIDNGDLSKIAWSTDGRVLFAAGRYAEGGVKQVVAWDGGGNGPRRLLPAGTNTVMTLRPLPDGALLIAAADPWLRVIASDGTPRWTQEPKQIDPRGQSLAVSTDGMLVEFGRKPWDDDRLRFDVALPKLLPPADDGRVAPPVQDTLAVADWNNSGHPTLDGAPLPLKREETSRSLAVHPDGNRLLLGADWTLRAFDKTGGALWQRPVPGVVWAVNISGDGRLAVAAYGDGTLRWHRMEDGAELLALFPRADGANWVAWTPEGFFTGMPQAKSLLHWHMNHGWDEAAGAIPVGDIAESNRPAVIRNVLPQLGTPGALATTELAKHYAAVRKATGSPVALNARLHVLAIGVSEYGEAAGHLGLDFAHLDACDITVALMTSQSKLYADVMPIRLLNGEATKSEVFKALERLRHGMLQGNGNDVAVILFSGHGTLVDGALYLLTHDADASTLAQVKATALPVGMLRDEIAAIAQHGRVLVFLDACRAGAATADHVGFALDARSLRGMLTAANVAIFTSSTAAEASQEKLDWENGAFTEALLEALRKADLVGDGYIRVSDLARYLSERVPELTGDRQRPAVSANFESPVFAAMH